ncbi:MAG: hypothetical protein JST48_14605 [Bacteroidetes bacterium]|nr:hypothetical protein [Bacteroidota bacterium]
MKTLYFNCKACVTILLLTGSVCVSAQLQVGKIIKDKRKNAAYEQITFVDLMKKYMEKDGSNQNNIEGIYSVSASALKKSKGLFSSTEKERTIDQKDNYATVAIIRDSEKNNREYIEVPLDDEKKLSYPIRGELTTASDANILILNHFEPKGKVLTYTIAYDQDKNLLEGIRTETSGSTTRTYKVVYLKMYPKAPQQTEKSKSDANDR